MSSSDLVQWAERPNGLDFPWVPVRNAMCGHTHKMVAVNSHISGVWTHWHYERTIPCIGKSNGCICATVKLGRRWKGFLPAVDEASWFLYLVELTANAMQTCQTELGLLGPDLRGRRFDLLKAGNRPTSPVVIAFNDLSPRLAALPAAIDTRRALRHIWGLPADW